jgi:hypothetical protein
MEDRSVTSFIKTTSSEKQTLESDFLSNIKDLVKERALAGGSCYEIIDIIYAVTGFGQAEVPGGESYVFGNLICELVKYAELRSKELRSRTRSNNLEDSLKNLASESIRLYGEVTSNRGDKPTVLEHPRKVG